MNLSQLLSVLYARVEQLLSSAPRGAFSITGLIGLALLVYGYFQLRGNDDRERQQQQAPQDAHQSAAEHRAPAAATTQQAASAPSSAVAASPAPGPAPSSSTPAGRAIAAQLSGAKRVTLSLPGVLLAESSPAELQDSATVRPGAAEVLRELAKITDVYLIAHVGDDLGEAVVTGALEAAGLVGSAPGQIRPHHVLCCSTLDGKVPIVRQLEPDLHIDAHPASTDELKRFLPRLLLVRDAGAGGAGSSYGGLYGAATSPNVAVAASLAEYFGC